VLLFLYLLVEGGNLGIAFTTCLCRLTLLLM
jgi:hypothetical protein